MGEIKEKLVAVLLSLAMVITGTGFTGITKIASAADNSQAEATLAEPIIKYWTAKDFPSDIKKEDLVGTKVTGYLQFTKSTPYSFVRFSAGMGPKSVCEGSTSENGSWSNKSLVGTQHSDQDNAIGGGWIIHNGKGDTAGTGKGEVGSGIYVTDKAGTTKATSVDNVCIRLQVHTKDTEVRLIGLVFDSGISVSVAEDGTLTKGFNPDDYQIEKKGLDSTDEKDKTPEEIEAEEKAKLEKQKNLLSETIKEYKSIPATKYIDGKKSLDAAISVAETVLNKENPTAEEYSEARKTLQNVRASLLFKDSDSAANPMPFRLLGKEEVIKEMGAGINLGNTMDGHSGFTPDETVWQGGTKTKTTKKLIKTWHDAGFNTVRVPVTWGTMIDTKNGYKIKESWMIRVQEIVDYCVEQDMYCIINIHHDGAEQTGWLRVGAEEIDSVYNQFEAVWRNIAEQFKNYDEHLIFESMNEVTDGDKGTQKEVQVLNNLNQIFVNVVRSTGSNNLRRWLAFVGEYASPNTPGLVMPEDVYNEVDVYDEEVYADSANQPKNTKRLMFAAHAYKDSTNASFSYKGIMQMNESITNMLRTGFDCPMYIGEWGNRPYKLSGSESGYNDQERACYDEIVHMAAQARGVCPILWDTQAGLDEEGVYMLWDRSTLKPTYQSIVDGMMRGTFNTPSEKNKKEDYSDIWMSYGHASTDTTELAKAPVIEKITDITVPQSVTMAAGTVKQLSCTVAPSNSNDVVLWSTDNDSVVTVYNGKLQAKATGVTTVHAYSQSGSISKDIKVYVMNSTKATAASIKTDKESYTVKKDSFAVINAEALSGESADSLMYTSTNPDVVTVNADGKLVGKEIGKAYVVISASSGITKTVPVTVTAGVLYDAQVNAALHILYNDAAHKYYGTELSEPVAIKEDGQYTVTFDINKELSADGKAAGITEINNLTAVYLKDYDITKKNITDSILKTMEVRFDKVVVNDTQLTLESNEFKNVLESGTNILDSGNPINAWGNNIVKETTIDSGTHVVTFNTTKPTKISITFTVANLSFKETAGPAKNEATKMDMVSKKVVTLAKAGDTDSLKVKLNAADTDSFVSFISSDTAVASVDVTGKATDKNANAEATVTAVANGTATVTAITENGLKQIFTIKVGDGKKTSIDPVTGEIKKPAPSVITPPSNNKPSTSNKCTKVKAKKNKVTIKKGKKATLQFIVTAKNNKKKTTDKLSVSFSKKKIVTLKKKSLKKGSASVQVLAKKKGTTKLTVKIGKKKTVVTIKVK